MALFKCKMCGGTLEVNKETVATCEYCGTQQTLPRLNDERKAHLCERAGQLRRNNEFDNAMGLYENILGEDSTDAEVYWSLVLCRYGIEYVEDPVSHKRIPTIHRAQFTPIFEDENYKAALAYADSFQQSVYQREAEAIHEIHKGILAISQQESPFDVFICYKESDTYGQRTPDSVLAQELYYELTQEGLKVFFARITLEDKLGTAYEPYIFAALNSAKVMVVLGTKKDHFNAVWVRNEWSRYLALIKQGQKKTLIPAYKDMDPSCLPGELAHLQAQDMNKLGFMQDLVRGIKKIIQPMQETTSASVNINMPDLMQNVVRGVKQFVGVYDPLTDKSIPLGQNNPELLVKRAALILEDGDVKAANTYCERALDLDPTYASAYVVKLLINLRLRTYEQLREYEGNFEDNPNYRRAIRFGDEALRTELEACQEDARRRSENAKANAVYTAALEQLKTASSEKTFLSLVEQLESLGEYQDAAALAKDCREKAEIARKDALLNDGIRRTEKRGATAADLEAAVALFRQIPGWKNADALAADCANKIAVLTAQAEAQRQEWIRQAEANRLERERQEEAKLQQKARQEEAKLQQKAQQEEDKLQKKAQQEEAKRLRKEQKAAAAYRKAQVRKEKAKKAGKILLILLLALIALVILWFTVLSPLYRYNRAQRLLDDGEYYDAFHYFSDLGDYRDAPEKAKETRYAHAEYLYSRGNYTAAAEIFQELGRYEDSSERYYEMLLEHACDLVDQERFSEAVQQLDDLLQQNVLIDEVEQLYAQIASIYCAEGDYEKAMALYADRNDGSEDSEQYKRVVYEYAEELFAQQQYAEAKTIYESISDYSNADTQVIECDYQLAMQAMSQQDYTAAVNTFEQIRSYKDSKEQQKKAKYLYVKANPDREDTTTYSYLKDLKQSNYEDSAEIYEDLYKWTIKLVCFNTDEEDYTTIDGFIPISASYVHYGFLLEGGEPGEIISLYCTTIKPNMSPEKADWVWKNKKDGDIVGAEWKDGFPDITNGYLVVRIFDAETDKMIGYFSMLVK